MGCFNKDHVLFDVDFDKSEMSFSNPSEKTFCNPLTKQKSCGECEFVSETSMELENYVQEKHAKYKEYRKWKWSKYEQW